MRLVFAGTSDFAVPALKALLNAGHEVAAVYTQPDRAAGRGRRIRISPVKEFALAQDLPIRQPQTLKSSVAWSEFKETQPEVLVVAAYGLLIPMPWLELPRWGGLNIHPSLLPRWRGAAPVERAILAGDLYTGVVIMQMDAGLDTGPILSQQTVRIKPTETAGELAKRLAVEGSNLLVTVLENLRKDVFKPRSQVGKVLYAERLSVSEAHLEFSSRLASELVRQIHAFNPRPGAWVFWRGERVKILRAQALDEASAPSHVTAGTVIAAGKAGIDVMAAKGVVRILQLQRPGKRPVSGADFANARPVIGTGLA